MRRSIFVAIGMSLALAAAAAAQQTYDYKNKRGDNVSVARSTKNGQVAVDKTVTGSGGKSGTVNKTIDGTGASKTATGPGGKSHTTRHKRHHTA